MTENCCADGTRLLYTCSGAADVGEVADRTARQLWKEGFAQKTCLAGVGANISGFVKSAEGADVNITIDGCPLACAKKSLEKTGVSPKSYILTEMGLEKGKVSDIPEAVSMVCESIKNNIGHSTKDGISTGCSCG